MSAIVDPVTGLGVSLPNGWVAVPGTPAALAVVDERAREAGALFVPNLVGTVSQFERAPDLDAIVSAATIAWLDSVPYSHVLGLLPWAPTNDRFDSRLVFGTYSNGMVSLTLITAVILANGIVSRLDLTVDASISRAATDLMFDVLDELIVPTSAPEKNLSGAEVVGYHDVIVERAMPK